MAPQPDAEPPERVRARTLARELAEFSARAGHDLLGPLNQASSLLALFVHHHKPAPGSESDQSEAGLLLDFLQSSAARMQGVIAGVQPFLNAAAAMPDFRPADLNEALAAAQLRLDKAIAASGAVIASDTLPVVPGNIHQMGTVFEALIDNAIKFRRLDEPPRIRISARQSGGDWIFTVADNGIGIDAEYREAVFLPFRRLHGKEFPGAGMGLATAKLIVGLHGGEIRIEPVSEDGTAPGAAVVFTAPVQRLPSGR